MYHFIYKTTCSITGKFYIGMHSTSDMDDGYLGSGLHLKRSIKKYGREVHHREILEHCSTRESLALRERVLVDSVLEEEQCMNIKRGGEGGGHFWSKEQQLKAAKAGGKKSTNANFVKPSAIAKATQTRREKYGPDYYAEIARKRWAKKKVQLGSGETG